MIIYKDILDKMIAYYEGNGTTFIMSQNNLIKAVEEIGATIYKGFDLICEDGIEENKIYLK